MLCYNAGMRLVIAQWQPADGTVLRQKGIRGLLRMNSVLLLLLLFIPLSSFLTLPLPRYEARGFHCVADASDARTLRGDASLPLLSLVSAFLNFFFWVTV